VFLLRKYRIIEWFSSGGNFSRLLPAKISITRQFPFQSHVPALPAHVDSRKEIARDFDWESMPARQDTCAVRRASATKFQGHFRVSRNSRKIRGFCPKGARIQA